MARQPVHSREEALEKALNLFWRKGYHATSLKDLEHALDMRPGSIYAAFRSKEALFREVLKLYATEVGVQFRAVVSSSPTTLDGVVCFLTEIGRRPENEPPSRACMLVKTLLEATDAQTAVAEDANAYLARIEAMFEDAFETSRRNGEIAADVDPKRLARRLQSAIFGLRVYAQRENSTDAVEELAEDMAGDFLSLRQRALVDPAA
ncbi:TetR/AcrR family transcriptional regulator [Amaricoccus macauensis]|uniref:TetR/AcrR family transcriptional regulator n=1 Tax=Amaricoccus macauensis TaxID=57001 RepID=UPI003C7EA835